MRKDKITDSQNVGEQHPIRFDIHQDSNSCSIQNAMLRGFNFKIVK
jgi:hypothetical protein